MTDLIQALSAQVEAVITPHARREETYALLDFPNYSNVGDSAIWLGELAILRKLHGRRPSYVCKTDQFDAAELQARVPTGPIYMNGGGNFGDLYTRHQAFREMIYRLYGSRVVQLPQSLHYSAGADLSSIRQVARGAKTLVMVRDKPSFDLAEDIGFKPQLVPDAALCLGPLDRIGSVTEDVVVLKRTDKESVHEGVQGVDWLDEHSSTTRVAKLRSISKLPLYPRERLFRTLAETRLRRGVRILSRGRRVATDRLHAHIICLLLDIPHAAADNSTGKIHAFIDQWTASSPLVRKVGSLQEAL